MLPDVREDDASCWHVHALACVSVSDGTSDLNDPTTYHGKRLCREQDLDQSSRKQYLYDLCPATQHTKSVLPDETFANLFDDGQQASMMDANTAREQITHPAYLRELSV